MSAAGTALQTAAIGALDEIDGIGGVYPGTPIQAAFPYATVEAGPEGDWSHKSTRGRELRLAVTLRSAGERPDLAQALASDVQDRLDAGLAPAGWQVVTLRLIRSRCVTDGKGGWIASVEYRARMLES